MTDEKTYDKKLHVLSLRTKLHTRITKDTNTLMELCQFDARRLDMGNEAAVALFKVRLPFVFQKNKE